MAHWPRRGRRGQANLGGPLVPGQVSPSGRTAATAPLCLKVKRRMSSSPFQNAGTLSIPASSAKAASIIPAQQPAACFSLSVKPRDIKALLGTG